MASMTSISFTWATCGIGRNCRSGPASRAGTPGQFFVRLVSTSSSLFWQGIRLAPDRRPGNTLAGERWPSAMLLKWRERRCASSAQPPVDGHGAAHGWNRWNLELTRPFALGGPGLPDDNGDLHPRRPLGEGEPERLREVGHAFRCAALPFPDRKALPIA
jgi:hypothetical protein